MLRFDTLKCHAKNGTETEKWICVNTNKQYTKTTHFQLKSISFLRTSRDFQNGTPEHHKCGIEENYKIIYLQIINPDTSPEFRSKRPTLEENLSRLCSRGPHLLSNAAVTVRSSKSFFDTEFRFDPSIEKTILTEVSKSPLWKMQSFCTSHRTGKWLLNFPTFISVSRKSI